MDNCKRDLFEDFMRMLPHHDTVTLSLKGVGETNFPTKELYESIIAHLRRPEPDCSGCIHATDMPAHQQCHGCARMYSDRYVGN